MITDHNLSQLDSLVREFFEIENITYGGPKEPYITRYQVVPKSDLRASFDSILSAVNDLGITAMMRREQDDIILFLIPATEKKKSLSPRLNLILFLLTLLSVLATGGLYGYQGSLPENFWQALWELIRNGWPFAVSLLAILGTHEFGHYFAGRKHKVEVTLPYFVPFPFSLFGTMGAFINMRSIPKDKRALFDLAVAGPLSGTVVSLIVLIIGLMLSEVDTIAAAPSAGIAFQMEGNSILYLLAKFAVFGKLLPNPPGMEGFDLFSFWIRYFFTGQPFPWGASDVMLHPVAWAGWAGLFVTGINLIPVSQLDGGHIFYTLFGKKTAQRAVPFIVGALVILGFFWNGWWLWAVLIFFLGQRTAETLDQITELDRKRRIIGYATLILFVLTFIPVPITIAAG